MLVVVLVSSAISEVSATDILVVLTLSLLVYGDVDSAALLLVYGAVGSVGAVVGVECSQ